MRFFLLKLTTNGVKNISEDVSLAFYRETGIDTITFPGNNIRAIYGKNGSGKSALILSVLLAKNLMSKSSYIASKPQGYFDELINKKTKHFSIEFIFAVYDEKKKNKVLGLMAYSLMLTLKDHRFQIVKECIEEIKGKSINGERELVAKNENGELSFASDNTDPFAPFLKQSTLNLLQDNTLVSQLGRCLKSYVKEGENLNNFESCLFLCCLFANSLAVAAQTSDLHDSDFPMPPQLLKAYSDMKAEDLKALFISNCLSSNGDCVTKVPKKEMPSYHDYIARLCAFLRLFKPTLKTIEIQQKEDAENFVCTNLLVYQDYAISEVYESTGIKKLISLFNSIALADRGGIVFVDELDANISGVYLQKLVEFISMYGHGQLIFTAHSLDPMYYLSKYSKSLYFLGDDNVMVPWIKNGHYQPYKLYPEGMIKGSAFNLEAFDFLSVFGEDK